MKNGENESSEFDDGKEEEDLADSLESHLQGRIDWYDYDDAPVRRETLEVHLKMVVLNLTATIQSQMKVSLQSYSLSLHSH